MTEPRQQARHRPDDASSHHVGLDGIVHSDGRLERRRRNRNAVLDAYLTLTDAGSAEPTMEQMAELAGVSHRSVFRYFDDRNALVVAVAERVMERLSPTMFVEPRLDRSFDARVDDFVSARVQAYGMLGPTAARVFGRCEDLMPGSLSGYRTRTTDSVRQHFATELSEVDSHLRNTIVELAAAPFQFMAMHALAESGGASRESLTLRLRTHLHVFLSN